MTKARAAVLAVLEAAEIPLCASSVLGRLADHPCDLATVYRTLDYFEKNGMAESFVLRCSEHGTERYFVSSARPHRHWFHCESCHRFIDIGECRLGSLIEQVEREKGLEIRNHNLYFTGLCADCRRSG